MKILFASIDLIVIPAMVAAMLLATILLTGNIVPGSVMSAVMVGGVAAFWLVFGPTYKYVAKFTRSEIEKITLVGLGLVFGPCALPVLLGLSMGSSLPRGWELCLFTLILSALMLATRLQWSRRPSLRTA